MPLDTGSHDAGHQDNGEPSVVLALFAVGHPTAALLGAGSFARAWGATLHVLRVLPETARPNPLSRKSSVVEAVRAIEQTLSAQRLTQSWLGDSLRDQSLIFRSTIAHGDFVAQTAAFVSQLRATLIIIPAHEARLGNLATSLASRSGVSVLVSRGAGVPHTILAATDLRNNSFPVLRKAAEVGEHFDAPVVALHNINPTADVAEPGTWLAPLEPDPVVRWRRLAYAFEQVPLRADATIRTDASAVQAILEEAHLHDADLVVVGTRRKHWFERLLARNIAAKVVNRCPRSVLVTPIGAPEM
jgi:nucleotide-binding universal stress UspA family protein